MKLFLTLITIFIFSEGLISQNTEIKRMNTIHLWPKDVPGETEAKNDPIQTKDTKGNVTRLTNVTDPTLTIFESDSKIKNGASVVICPGGGYNILAINKEGTEIAEWLTELGFTAFVLQYRVPKKQEGALMDVQRAIRIIRSKSESMNLDATKIGVMGFSAGGSLSARVSTNYLKETYSPIDEIDQVSCRPDYTLLIYPAYLDLGTDRSITPELMTDATIPPMFIFATADDPYANSALVMATHLRDNNVPVELHLLPKGGHGYGLRKETTAGETWPLLAEKWLSTIIN